MEKSIEDNPLIIKDSTSTNKKILITILSIIGLALCVVAVIVIILISQENYEKENEDENLEDESEYGLTIEQLEYRTNSEHLGYFTFLTKESNEYNNLDNKDKEALKHLIKAASLLEDIDLRIDNIHNIPFRTFLEKEINNDTNKHQANLTKILFDSQKGIFGRDSLKQNINLAKKYSKPLGIGVYPEDLTVEKFHEILTTMLNEGKIEEVDNITNQRSIVEWDDNKQSLKSTDYIIYFQDKFNEIADELIEASKVSTNADFNEYLVLQAKALKTADPNLDAEADKKWATLQNTPLEFTLTRENKYDFMTDSIDNNEALFNLLNKSNIAHWGKDSLGIRVGIVNQEGTNLTINITKTLPSLFEELPSYDQYKSQINTEEINTNVTTVDVDLIILTGSSGAYRGQISLGEILPNMDKLSLAQGGGKRRVYHRQMRKPDTNKLTQKLEDILDSEQIKYYDPDAIHWFSVTTQVTQYLGPNVTDSSIEDYIDILELCRRELISFAFIDRMKELNTYNEEQVYKFKLTNIVNTFMKEQPDMNQIVGTSHLLIINFLLEKEVINLTNGKIKIINFTKVANATKDMLTEIITIELNDDNTKAKEFYQNYSKWNNDMNTIANKLKKYDNELHYLIKNELADYLLNE